jgi:hypothetical protein
MKLSSIDRRLITTQRINEAGQLVTEFNESLFYDESLMHPAGILINDPVIDSRGLDDESVYSESCTRYVDGCKIIVWDSGKLV